MLNNYNGKILIAVESLPIWQKKDFFPQIQEKYQRKSGEYFQQTQNDKKIHSLNLGASNFCQISWYFKLYNVNSVYKQTLLQTGTSPQCCLFKYKKWWGCKKDKRRKQGVSWLRTQTQQLSHMSKLQGNGKVPLGHHYEIRQETTQ